VPAGRGSQMAGRRLRIFGIVTVGLAVAIASAPPRTPSDASSAPERLSDRPLDQPLRIDSTETDGRLHGDIRGVIEHPFRRVRVLADPAHWCELVTLLPNIRQCRAAADRQQLTLWFARRFDEPVSDTHAVRFDVRTRVLDDLLEVVLRAPDGPVGTSDYRLELTAVPVGEGRVSLRVRYGYAYGLTARLLARLYLAVGGRDKVGFTVVGTDAEGNPQYIDGLRGAVERNAMRLYLAIDAYLDVVDEAPGNRRERSLRAWLDAITGYPRQLAEADPAAYFEAKRERLP
jgi:hypothetical protein